MSRTWIRIKIVVLLPQDNWGKARFLKGATVVIEMQRKSLTINLIIDSRRKAEPTLVSLIIFSSHIDKTLSDISHNTHWPCPVRLTGTSHTYPLTMHTSTNINDEINGDTSALPRDRPQDRNRIRFPNPMIGFQPTSIHLAPIPPQIIRYFREFEAILANVQVQAEELPVWQEQDWHLDSQYFPFKFSNWLSYRGNTSIGGLIIRGVSTAPTGKKISSALTTLIEAVTTRTSTAPRTLSNSFLAIQETN